MSKKIFRVTSNKKEAVKEAREVTASLKERGIKREAVVCDISLSYAKKLRRKDFPLAKRYYGIYTRYNRNLKNKKEKQ